MYLDHLANTYIIHVKLLNRFSFVRECRLRKDVRTLSEIMYTYIICVM